MIGPTIFAAFTGCSFENIVLTIILKIKKASMQPATGDKTQLTTTEPTASHNYDEQDTYIVSLTVLDNFESFDPQGFDTYTFTITVTRI